MVIYPFNGPIILNDINYSQNGGLGTGSFTSQQLQSSYWLAEMQVSQYIGTLLLPQIVTGTYSYMGKNRIATDYGYVSQLLNVNVYSKKGWATCDLQRNDGCGYIYNDTYGYIDFKQVSSICGVAFWVYPLTPYQVAYNYPYQIQITYEAGLPTGTANQPGMLEALTILAQIDLNEKSPGTVGQNEGQGDIAIQSFRSLDYSEQRGAHSLVKTALGESPKAMRAKRLIDMSIRRSRRVLFA
ncbi:MAG TPA: hypothetical protein VIY48_06445 [Candidatus Paceibacterota bacterium]